MSKKITERAVLEELAARALAKTATAGLVQRIRGDLFDKQLAFVDDPSREKCALCTRRAGKTSMWPRYCFITALEHTRVIIRIWGITRLRAKQLLWDEFKQVAQKYSIDVSFNETELTARLSNGSEIRLLGADKDKEVQKKRGDKTIMEVVLEAQLFGPYLQKLVEDVAGPSLFDLKGTMCLEGTPGSVCAGYWYDATGQEDVLDQWVSQGNKKQDGTLVGAGWSVHRWSLLDNPMMPQWTGKPNWQQIALAELKALKEKRRWTDDNPTWLREYRGRWVNDLGALYYKADSTRNLYDPAEIQPFGPGWEHTLGWDLGFKDDMALVVWGWHPNRPFLYEAYSWKQPGALSSDVIGKIKELEARGFNFVKRVADTGGGGKMYVEDVQARFGMHFEAAKKTEKYEHVRLFNDDLLGGFVKFQEGSVYWQEISQLPRDLDWPPPDKAEAAPREDPRFPNHCCDAGLYGYRAARHYLHVDEPLMPKVGTEGFAQREAARMEAFIIERKLKQKYDIDDEVDAEWE